VGELSTNDTRVAWHEGSDMVFSLLLESSMSEMSLTMRPGDLSPDDAVVGSPLLCRGLVDVGNLLSEVEAFMLSVDMSSNVGGQHTWLRWCRQRLQS
jgi:hypothetical protein